jgi:hypothetical protein
VLARLSSSAGRFERSIVSIAARIMIPSVKPWLAASRKASHDRMPPSIQAPRYIPLGVALRLTRRFTTAYLEPEHFRHFAVGKPLPFESLSQILKNEPHIHAARHCSNAAFQPTGCEGLVPTFFAGGGKLAILMQRCETLPQARRRRVGWRAVYHWRQ